ncbi:tyrosine--tRNA ligase [bacterium]|nr:tyrosine--tRNA ligase [bacterium]
MTLLQELRARGLLQDHTPGVEELLTNEKVKGYIGYDPTAPSLTIGNLVTIMMLVHLQRHGHTPVVLFGGATGRVGDPSGKDAERKMLDIETIEHNLAHQQKQFQHILRFDQGDNEALLTNNYNWFKDISFLDFLRDAGKHLTVNYMMSKESVKRRIETGISFTEFSYQLLQGYDFYHMYQNMGVKLQMGGSDQWGNITTGTELIRRKVSGEAFAITCPLLTKADGTKFGKSEGQNIWLDPEMTSPYKFYQFFINATDDDAPRFFRIFSLRSIEEIEQIIADNAQNPNQLKRTLAEDVTKFVHGEEALEKAIATSQILFGKGTKELLFSMSEKEMLETFEGVPTFEVEAAKFADGLSILDLLGVETQILCSKGEAKREIKGNAISLNLQKVGSDSLVVAKDDLINGKFLVVNRGKRNFHLVVAK